ncbi:hypothetical protein [Tessaracoccus sp. G1721]
MGGTSHPHRRADAAAHDQREHGYYVLLVLIDDEIAARGELKSDRKAGVLRVQHAHIEPAYQTRIDDVARRVAPLLTEAAKWQGLSAVSVEGVGTLAAAGQAPFSWLT